MFNLVSPFAPAGDQPQAIAMLVKALASGIRHQVLPGVTGSGKPLTIARRSGGCRDARPASYSGHEFDDRNSAGD
jgi:hypothetical protein